MKEGYITCSITKVVVQGEARVGKTSLKCALTKEGYTKTSTSVIDPSVAVRCYSRDSDKGQYRLISVEEMRAKVKNAVKSEAKDKAATDKAATDKAATDKAAASKAITDEAAIIDYITAFFDTDIQIQVLKPSQEASEVTTLSKEASSVLVNETRGMKNAIAIVKKFRDDCEKAQEKGKTLDNEHWLYFIDSGGQIQFQKLLPVFMPFASVLIVVVSLAKNLTERSEEVMHYEGEDMTTGSKTLTVEEVLKQLFSSIIPSTFNYMGFLANDPNLSKHIKFAQHQLESPTSKPPRINIIPVATYGDKLTDVELVKNEIKAKLNDMVKCHKNKCKLYMPEGVRIIIHLLEVDGRIADPETIILEDRKLITKQSLETIAEELDKNAYKINVPLNWYCFDVLLHEVASEGCGILTLSFCEELGKELGMSPPEIKSALNFLHLFNKILYYHKSEACSDLVFVEINSLVSILKELVMSIYKGHLYKGSVYQQWVPLVSKGKLTIENMVKVCKDVLNDKKNSNEATSDFQHPQFEEKLLKLFHELLIAAPLSPHEYFIPALLPLKDVTHVPLHVHSNADPSPPLLFCFEDAVPMGLFCAVIVHLLSHSLVKWELSDSKTNYSNYFALECAKDSTVKIILVEHVDYIELCCVVKDYQGIARESVEEAIISATEKHKLDPSVYKKGFYCSCDDAKDGKHFAIFSSLIKKYVIECKEQNDSWMHWLTCEF